MNPSTRLFRIACPLLLLAEACASAPPVPEAQSTQKAQGDLAFSPRAKFPAYPDKYGPRVCMDEGHRNLGVSQRHYGPILDLIESDGFRMHRRRRKLTAGTCLPGGKHLPVRRAQQRRSWT